MQSPQISETVPHHKHSKLENLDWISATTDVWSRVNMTHYMSIRVHYLTTGFLNQVHLEAVFMSLNRMSESTLEAFHHSFDK